MWRTGGDKMPEEAALAEFEAWPPHNN